MKLSLVVPCYNEEDTIEKFYEAVKGAFINHIKEYELIFVNDGSRDQTLHKLHQIYNKKEKNIKVVSFSRNFGKEAAMFAGLKQAIGEYVTIIDADLQQRPEVVVKMVEILDEKPEIDCVAAYQEERKEGKVLSFFKNSFYKLINKMAEVDFVSGASDFRTFRQPVNQAIQNMTEYNRFSKGIFSWVGFEVFYMPYEVQEREGGTSKWSFVKLFHYALDGIMAFTTAPLKIAVSLGGILSFGSVVYFIVYLLDYLLNRHEMSQMELIIGIILLLCGLQLLVLGIIGEYLAKLYIEGKNRPIYIAKEILSYSDENEEKKDDQ
ncbi:MAG: glycosyltransferase family 2 protein [bacterium]|nr:glycosyltransferase family 2 protein [bacterium]